MSSLAYSPSSPSSPPPSSTDLLMTPHTQTLHLLNFSLLVLKHLRVVASLDVLCSSVSVRGERTDRGEEAGGIARTEGEVQRQKEGQERCREVTNGSSALGAIVLCVCWEGKGREAGWWVGGERGRPLEIRTTSSFLSSFVLFLYASIDF